MQTDRKAGRKGATYIATLMAATLCGALRLNAAAQTPRVVPPLIEFSTEADAISGTVTTTLPEALRPKTEISPVDQSTSTMEEYKTISADAAVKSVFGMEVYNFSTVLDVSFSNDTEATNEAEGEAALFGPGLLLGGLITWDSAQAELVCSPDAHIAGQVNCNYYDFSFWENLLVNGVAYPSYPLKAGVAIPVTGPIDDYQCQSIAGTESFNGTLINREVQITDNGTPTPSVKLIGFHLVGEATCNSQGATASTLFSTHYDLAVGSTTITQHEKSGDGILNIVYVQ